MNALSNVLQSSASSWAALDAIAGEAGVMSRQVSLARAGKPVDAGAFLALCAVTGVDPVGGASRPARTLTPNVAWWLLSWALYTTRALKKLDQRAAAEAIGISAASVCRVETSHPVSIGVLLKVCAFIGVHPFGFTAPPVCLPESVSRGTSTETYCSRSDIDSDTALAAPPASF
jgi:transcriptional regulator with XRE-family HTH domain